MASRRGRRGRPRREDQLYDRLRLVIALFRQAHDVLDRCQTFDQCSGAQQLLAIVKQRLPRAVYVRGTTLDLLIQGAALDVMGELYATERPRDERLAQFIRGYFFEGRTIVDITTQVLGLGDRSHVSKHYRIEACDFVARRFLMLVEHDDPLVNSSGVREALARQVQRWDRAARRVSDALKQLYDRRYGVSGVYGLAGASASLTSVSAPSVSTASATREPGQKAGAVDQQTALPYRMELE